MKIKDGYIKVESFDGYVVTPVGEESLRNRIMLTLNESASRIWDMLKEEKSVGEIVESFTGIYDISAQQAQEDVLKVIDLLKSEGLLTE